jgi:hypothetical protein
MTYFLVHDDVHSDAGLSPALEDSIETIVLVEFAWPSKV